MQKKVLWLGALSVALTAQVAVAKVGPDQAAKLGKDLTPIGAEKAASKDGLIPEWTGGEAHRGNLKADWPNDPAVEKDAVKFTITQANYAQYKDKLSAGQQELLKRFADYKIPVYPSRRVVSFPQAIYDATEKNATTCELQGSDQPQNCTLGFPFPIPTQGAEIIWNHKLKWRGNSVKRYNNQLIVQPDGSFQKTTLEEDAKFAYANTDTKETLDAGHTDFLKYLSQTLSPPRLAGTFILVHEKASTGDAGRQAWLYSPGLRRIRRAPNVQYDNPYEGTDGNEFYDQVDMFNGALELYNWKLVGKQEMFIGYNSYKMSKQSTHLSDLVRPHHLNQDLTRYEPHRVWVVEATLKPGKSHVFKKRVFYVDEDSWDICAEDDYDNRDQLYKYHEGFIGFAPEIQTASTVPEIIYDFVSGRYFVTAAINDSAPDDWSVSYTDDFFTAAAVQKQTLK